MQKFNHWFGKKVMTAASSPNEAGDQTGGLNKALWLCLSSAFKSQSGLEKLKIVAFTTS